MGNLQQRYLKLHWKLATLHLIYQQRSRTHWKNIWSDMHACRGRSPSPHRHQGKSGALAFVACFLETGRARMLCWKFPRSWIIHWLLSSYGRNSSHRKAKPQCPLNRMLWNIRCTFSYIIILTYEDQINIFYYFVNTYVATLSIFMLGFVARKIHFSTASLALCRDVFYRYSSCFCRWKFPFPLNKWQVRFWWHISLRLGLPLIKELKSQSKNVDSYGLILKQYRFYRSLV